eukprot:225835-Amphidinium_carterae.1
MPVALAQWCSSICRSPWQKCSRVEEVKLARCAWSVVVGEDRLDGIFIRVRCASSGQVGVVLGAKDHRYLRAVHEVAVIRAHIIATQVDKCAVVYPKGLVNRVETAAPTTPPVTRSVCGGALIETIVTINFPASSGTRLILAQTVGHVR